MKNPGQERTDRGFNFDVINRQHRKATKQPMSNYDTPKRGFSQVNATDDHPLTDLISGAHDVAWRAAKFNFSDAEKYSSGDYIDYNDGPSLGEIKKLLRDDIEALVEYLFAGEKHTSRARNEIRYGARGSLQIHTRGAKRGNWRNYESGEGGSPLDLIMYAQHTDFSGALEIACDWLGVSHGKPGKKKIKRRSVEELAAVEVARAADLEVENTARVKAAANGYHAALHIAKHEPVKWRWLKWIAPAYLRTRGFEAFSGDSGGAVASQDRLGHHIIFPAHDLLGQVTGYQRVYVKFDGTKSSVGKLSTGIIDGAGYHVKAHGEPLRLGYVAITEGPEDALTLAQAGIDAYAAFGVSNLARLPLPDGVKVLAFLDDDRPGALAIESADRAVDALREDGFDVEVIRRYGGCKDINELLQRDGPEAVREVVQELKVLKPNDALQRALDADSELKYFDYSVSGYSSDLKTFESLKNVNEIPCDALADIAKVDEKARAVVEETVRDVFQLSQQTGTTRDKKVALLEVTTGGGKTYAAIAEIVQFLKMTRERDGRQDAMVAEGDGDLMISPREAIHIDIYAPTHDLCCEIVLRLREEIGKHDIVTLASFDIVHMRGRGGLCERDSKVRKRMEEESASIASNACEQEVKEHYDPIEGTTPAGVVRCPSYERCGFMSLIDEVRDTEKHIIIRVWPHSYLNQALSFKLPPASIIIIDEDPASVFQKETLHDVGMFTASHIKTERKNQHGDAISSVSEGERADYLVIMAKVREALGGERARIDRTLIQIQENEGRSDARVNKIATVIAENGIMRAVREVCTREEIEFQLNIERRNIQSVFAVPSDSDEALSKKLPRNQESVELERIWHVIRDEWDTGAAYSAQLQWETHSTESGLRRLGQCLIVTTVSKGPHPDAEDREANSRFERARENILLMDATPRVEALADSFGPLKVVKAAFYENMIVYQDARHTFSVSRLKNDPAALGRVVETIVRIRESCGGNGIIICPKQLSDGLAELIPEMAGSNLYFGVERGVDGFKDCDWVVIVGGQRPNPQQVYREVATRNVGCAFISPETSKRPRSTNVRCVRNAQIGFSECVSLSGVGEPQFIDERGAQVVNEILMGGIAQGVGRVRAARAGKKAKRIFILGTAMPEHMVVDHVELPNTLARSEKAAERQGSITEKTNGVLIARPEWIHAVAADEFTTVEAARLWLKRSGLKPNLGHTPIESFNAPRPKFENGSKPGSIFLFTGTVRIRGQVGNASRVKVYALGEDVEDAKRRLHCAAEMGRHVLSDVEIYRADRLH